jgi:hypothetical protein
MASRKRRTEDSHTDENDSDSFGKSCILTRDKLLNLACVCIRLFSAAFLPMRAKRFYYTRMHRRWASARLVEMENFVSVGEAMLQGVVEQRFAIMVQIERWNHNFLRKIPLCA